MFTRRANHDRLVQALLSSARIAATPEQIGYAASSVRQSAIAGGMAPPPSGVDAIVAAEADALAANDDVCIITTDDDDLELLASLATNAERLSVLAP